MFRQLIPLVVVLFGVAFGKPNLFHTFPTYYEHLAAPHTNVLHSIKSQFHTQDELGQYMYGYNDGLSSKIESKTMDGITQGSYAYVDPNGVLQNVNYISDDLNGFRVSASNLPVAQTYQYPMQQEVVLTHHSPSQIIGVSGTEAASPSDESNASVAVMTSQYDPTQNNGGKDAAEKKNATDKLAKATAAAAAAAAATTATRTAMLSASDAAPTVAAANMIPTAYTYQPFAPYSLYPHGFAAVPLTSFRLHNISPYSPVYSQFHSQDELGQYSYGYSGGPSSKIEVKTADGITRGGYSYIDANGIFQKVNYIADAVNGFRVAGTNLPISNMATSYYPTEYHLPEFNLIGHPDKTKTLD